MRISRIKNELLETIKNNHEIQSVFSLGIRFCCKGLCIYVLTKDIPKVRVLFAVSKRVRSKPQKHTQIRKARECVRILIPHIRKFTDIAFVFTERNTAYKDMTQRLILLLVKAGLIHNGSL